MTKSERHKQWVAANRDRARAYEKSAKVQAYRKAYYQANKERWREKVREFRHKRQALLRAAKDVPCTDCGIQYPP